MAGQNVHEPRITFLMYLMDGCANLIGCGLMTCWERMQNPSSSSIVAVQSFADGRLGCGTIYKAANFDYYGYHITRFFRDKLTGEVFQGQGLSNADCRSRFLHKNIDLLLGKLGCFDVKTYRYMYPFHKSFVFTGTKKKPYPPYEKGTTSGVEKIKPDHLVGRLTTVLQALAAKYPHQ